MNIPKKLKLNQFRVVQIPSGKEIFTRFGLCPGTHFTGNDQRVPPMTKTDAAAACNNIASEDVENLDS